MDRSTYGTMEPCNDVGGTMAKKKQPKSTGGRKGRPVMHGAGYKRTTLIMPVDLLRDVTRLLADMIPAEGYMVNRSELARAFFRAAVESYANGKLDFSDCHEEEDLYRVIFKKLNR
ncbi:hypothetical protein ACFL59_09545 [Planctomycetota bacterium]